MKMPRTLASVLVILAGLLSCQVPGLPAVAHFPLDGAHLPLECATCHPEGLSLAVSKTCRGCHTDDEPADHFDWDCDTCHNTTDWAEVDIDHGFFPLRGGHDTDCLECHPVEGEYRGLDAACVSCHEADAPPNHYEGACDRCHGTFTWEDAEIDHDRYFPTPHEGVSRCDKCHPGGDNRTFTCIDCHAHRRQDMDSEHSGEEGYRYASPQCLRCHPRGDDWAGGS